MNANAQIIKVTKTYSNGDTFSYTYGQLEGRIRTPDNFSRSWKNEKDPFGFTLDEFAENTGREWFPVKIETTSVAFTPVKSDENPQVDQTRTVFTLEVTD